MELDSPFLGLPPELRNTIYEYVALLDHPYRLKARLKPKYGRYIASHSGLILTSCQIADEYCDVRAKIALLPSTKLVAPVTDLNFRFLIKFINAEMLAVDQTAASRPKGKLIIEITLSSLENVHPDHLGLWLKFSQALGIEASYAVNNSTSGPQTPSNGELWGVKSMSDFLEARKITEALLDWTAFRRAGKEKRFVEAVMLPRT